LLGTLDISAQELIAEIAASIPQPLQPGEITRKMLQDGLAEAGITLAKSSVQARLDRMVERGELTRRSLPGGEIAYRRSE
jgi:hypothetical protein